MPVSPGELQSCYDPREMRVGGGIARGMMDCIPGRFVVAALLLLAAAGCGGSGSDRDDGWYTLLLVPEAGTDPFAHPAAEFLYLRIETAELEPVAEQEFPLSAEEYVLDDSPTGRELYFVVEVRDAATPRNVLAEGRSGPHALVEDEHTTVTVVLEAP